MEHRTRNTEQGMMKDARAIEHRTRNTEQGMMKDARAMEHRTGNTEQGMMNDARAKAEGILKCSIVVGTFNASKSNLEPKRSARHSSFDVPCSIFRVQFPSSFGVLCSIFRV